MAQKITGHILAFLIGFLPGFFLVFASVFSDGGSLQERVFTFLLVLVAYLILGAIFGFWWPRSLIFLSLSATALIILILYTLSDSLGQGKLVVMNATYGVLTIAGSYGGSKVGEWLKTKRKK